MFFQAAVLSVLFCSVHMFTIQAFVENSDESSGNTIDDDEFTVSSLLEKANVDVGKNLNDPLVMFGDIAVLSRQGNADPCTARGCLWRKASDGNVYVPYRISSEFSSRERDTIVQGLRSFADSTCIRFFPASGQRDFVNIRSLSGCFSYVGRRGGSQDVSLNRRGCVYKKIIQHELLHALGFDHEQTRSDRDRHVRILLQNVMRGMEHNFDLIQTRNLGTPYDYNSVMHYSRYAFSRNRQPTIIPIPNSNVAIGRAEEMSAIDIARVNILYQCNRTVSRRPAKEELSPEMKVK